jgi:1-deoxy-D-xylulose 5-phosphate reductoisomerase
MPKAKRIILLGATGSIGSNTLEIIRRFPKDFQLVGISAHTNSQALAQIAETYKVPSIALSDESTYQERFKQNYFQNIVQFMVATKHCTNSLKQPKQTWS